MNLGFSIGACDAMSSCFGGGGLGDVRDVLNPQATRRIKGILVRDILSATTETSFTTLHPIIKLRKPVAFYITVFEQKKKETAKVGIY